MYYGLTIPNPRENERVIKLMWDWEQGKKIPGERSPSRVGPDEMFLQIPLPFAVRFQY